MDLETAYDLVSNLTNEDKLDPKKLKLCPDCGDRNIIDDQMRGKCVCGNCGRELMEYFDSSMEVSNWEDKNDNDRCAQQNNYFLPQASLGTSIGGMNNKLKRLHIWSQMPYEERSLYDVLQEIEVKCRKENIPKSVIDNARNLYKKFTEQKNKNGKKINERADREDDEHGGGPTPWENPDKGWKPKNKMKKELFLNHLFKLEIYKFV